MAESPESSADHHRRSAGRIVTAAKAQELPWYFASGENSWGDRPQTLADLGLDSLQQARVLEWFAFKVWVASNEGTPDGDYHSKSYDPLTIELGARGGGTAHSYVFNLNSGGRHHGFSSLAELERLLFEEAIGTVRWAYKHGQEDALEALARFFWLDANPGKEDTWDSWAEDRLDWEAREPYYDRARSILSAERPAAYRVEFTSSVEITAAPFYRSDS